jgi:hypothetical protein
MRKLLLIVPAAIALPVVWGAIAFAYVKIRHRGVPAGEKMPETAADYVMAGLGLTVSAVTLPFLLAFSYGCHLVNKMRRSTAPIQK